MNEAVAAVIRALREKSRFSQEQLAGYAKTSRSQIAQLEAGKRGVTLSSLYWLSESLGVPFLELVTMIDRERAKRANRREPQDAGGRRRPRGRG